MSKIAKNLIPKKVGATLIFIFSIIAILLRIIGINFDLWAFDEEQNFSGAVGIVKWLANCILEEDIPNLEGEYIVSIYGVVGKYLSIPAVVLGFGFEALFSRTQSIPLALILSRVFVSFLPNIFTIYVTHLFLKKAHFKRATLVYVVFLWLFTFKHIETAHYAVSDSLSAFFVVSSLYLFLAFQQAKDTNKRKYLLGLALSLALCILSKINVGFILSISIFFASLFFYKSLFQTLKKWLFKVAEFSLYLLTFLFIINLPYFLSFSKWWEILVEHIYHYPYMVKGTWTTLFHFIPAFGVGYFFVFLAILGIVLAVVQSKKTLFTPIVFLLLFYVFLSTSRGVIHRWAIPMIPVLVILGAYLLSFFAEFIKEKLQLSHFLKEKNQSITAFVVPLILVILFMGNNLKQAIYFNLNLVSTNNSYEQLNDYYQANITGKKCIGNFLNPLNLVFEETAFTSVEKLDASNAEYAIFGDFWFLGKRYPESIIYRDIVTNRMKGDWRPIRKHIENNWTLVKKIEPKYYTNWSANIAFPPPFYIYKKQ